MYKINTSDVETVETETTTPEEMLPEMPDEMQEDETEDESENLDGNIEAMESLAAQIEHLSTLATAIETYGISPGMMMIADREGLLSSTFISIPATESMAGNYRPESSTSTAALEGVVSAIASKVAEWTVRAVTTAKNFLTKAGGSIARSILGVARFSKTLLSRTWNATKAGAAVVKAHPYKTIMFAIAAMAAAAVFINAIWGGRLPTKTTDVAAWLARMRSSAANIKSPFGKIVFTGKESNLKPMWSPNPMAAAAPSGKVIDFGYTTNSSVVNVSGNLRDTLVRAAKTLGSTLASVPGRIRSAVSGVSGAVPSTEAQLSTGHKVGVAVILGVLVFTLGLTGAIMAGIFATGCVLVLKSLKSVNEATTQPAAA